MFPKVGTFEARSVNTAQGYTSLVYLCCISIYLWKWSRCSTYK